MKLRTFLLFSLSLSASVADDITLSDGTTYKGATIVKHDAVNATILYVDGGATVPITKLPASMQAKLGYNADAAAKQMTQENEQIEADAAAKLQNQIRKAMQDLAVQATGKIIQVLPDGFMAELSQISSRQITVSHHEQSLSGASPPGFQQMGVIQSHDWTTEETRSSASRLGRVFVITDTSGLIDDQLWSGTIWKIGTYSYTTTMGAPATLAKYTTSQQQALEALSTPHQAIPTATANND